MWPSLRRPTAPIAAAALAWRSQQRRHLVCEEQSKAERVFVTYNVLSSHLASPTQFRRSQPEDLVAETRLRRLEAKLKPTVDRGAVLGLQEVSSDWAGELHCFFASHGYHTIFARYGETFNGHMGVLLAYPASRFQAEKVKLHHVGENLPESPCAPSPWSKHLSPCGILSYEGMSDLLRVDPESINPDARRSPRGPNVEALNPRKDREWALAQRRQNIAIFARLRPLDRVGGTFSVGVYHMPCLFATVEDCQSKNIHTLALRNEFAKFAAGGPCVLLGDFNFRSDSPSYGLLQGDALGHEEAPQSPSYGRLLTNDFPLRSAYAEVHGGEPHRFQLDFVWVSSHCRVNSCPKIVPDGPRPSAKEPSDHMLVEATIEI